MLVMHSSVSPSLYQKHEKSLQRGKLNDCRCNSRVSFPITGSKAFFASTRWMRISNSQSVPSATASRYSLSYTVPVRRIYSNRSIRDAPAVVSRLFLRTFASRGVDLRKRQWLRGCGSLERRYILRNQQLCWLRQLAFTS